MIIQHPVGRQVHIRLNKASIHYTSWISQKAIKNNDNHFMVRSKKCQTPLHVLGLGLTLHIVMDYNK